MSMHTDKITIQKSVKAYLSLVLHMNESTSSPHVYTITHTAHVTVSLKIGQRTPSIVVFFHYY